MQTSWMIFKNAIPLGQMENIILYFISFYNNPTEVMHKHNKISL
jgi:hypothetical protein